MRRLALLGVTALLAVAACTSGNGAVPTTEPPPSPPTSASSTTTTSAPTPAAVTVIGCDRPEEPFGLLCRAHDILVTEHVAPPPEELLARGAARGVEEHADPVEVAAGPVTCAVPSEAFQVLCEAYAERVRPGSERELVEAAIRGMIEFGLEDPFTRYLDPQLAALEREDLSGRVEGIGALVRTADLENPDQACHVLGESCALLIVEPLEGGPADRIGLRAGDRVISVDGESVEGWTIEHLISRVRGPAGTEVTLGILRDGERLKVTVTREAVAVPVVDHRMLDDRVGYLHLLIFSSGSAELVEDALEDLRREGARTVLFDLQDDPGGLLHEAVGVADHFLDGGTVVVQRTAGEEDVVFSADPGGVWSDAQLRTVVLVNRGTASASEVVAAALQESERAVVIGEETFGKGSVQQEFELPDGSVLRVTVAEWLTPAGRSLAGQGITPDVSVSIPPDAEREFLLERALEWLRQNR